MDCLECGTDIGQKIGLCATCRTVRINERPMRSPTHFCVRPGETIACHNPLPNSIIAVLFGAAGIVIYACIYMTLSKHSSQTQLDSHHINFPLLSACITAAIFTGLTWLSLWIQMATTRIFAAIAILFVPPLLWIVVFTNWDYLKNRFLVHMACVFVSYALMVLLVHSQGTPWHESFGAAVVSLVPDLLHGRI